MNGAITSKGIELLIKKRSIKHTQDGFNMNFTKHLTIINNNSLETLPKIVDSGNSL